MSENNKKILGILPHSIGGRLTISSVFDGFRQNGFEVKVFDELKQENFLDFIKEKNYEYLIGYDFSGLKLKVDNNLDVKISRLFLLNIYKNHHCILCSSIDLGLIKSAFYGDNCIFGFFHKFTIIAPL